MRAKTLVGAVVIVLTIVALLVGLYYLNFTGTQTAKINAAYIKVNPEEYGGMNYFFYAESNENPFYAIHAYKDLEEILDENTNKKVEMEFLINGRWHAWGIMAPKFNGKLGSISKAITIEREYILRNAK